MPVHYKNACVLAGPGKRNAFTKAADQAHLHGQDAVRGDHGEVVNLIVREGGKVLDKEGELVDLADSHLAGNCRIFTDYSPEWEIDPSTLKMQEKIGAPWVTCFYYQLSIHRDLLLLTKMAPYTVL